MTDTPTTRNRFRKQEVGTNNNTWGTNLNQVLDCVDQVTDGYLAIALASSSDYTLTTTNYTTADEAKNRVLKFTGTLSSAVEVIAPSVQHQYTTINASGATLTFNTAAGTGVALPNNRQCDVYSDASDFYCGSANWIPHYATSSFNNGDIMVYTTTATLIAAAIAAASISNTGQLLVSATDTTSGYGQTKIIPYGTLAASVGNSGSNETLNIKPALYTIGGTDTYTITPSPAYTAYGTDMVFYGLFTNANTGAATLEPNGLGSAKALTKNGSTALAANDIAAGSIHLIAYDGTRFQLLNLPAPALGLVSGSDQTAGFTAAVNTKYVCNFSAAATITFPSSATAGDIMAFAIGGGQVVTLGANGLKINGSTSNLVIGNQPQTIIVEYTGATNGWV